MFMVKKKSEKLKKNRANTQKNDRSVMFLGLDFSPLFSLPVIQLGSSSNIFFGTDQRSY